MVFPIQMKRSPGTVYAWEKNDWSRRHGYQLPIDSYLLLQWLCLLLLDAAFFCYLIHFLAQYQLTATPSIENLLVNYNEMNMQYVNPFQLSSCKISFFYDSISLFLSNLFNF